MGGAKPNPSGLFVAGTGHSPVKERTGHGPVKERKALLDRINRINRERRRISTY
jgi:hypothetical protein